MKALNSKTIILSFVVLSVAFNTAGAAVKSGAVALPGHPRILLLKGEEEGIRKTIASDVVWKKMHSFIIDESDKILDRPPVQRILIGRRLLDKSREALRRIFYLSYSYRMTADEKYLARAEKELLAISAFSDWNPSHFLDVAEMTMAASIGYDWLYGRLSPGSRQKVRDAIKEKGLEQSLLKENNSWLNATHNWNQVCNAGMTFGGLAIYEDDPELAMKMIDRAKSSIILPMNDYMPDGAYPEGYSYWGYGTSFNIMFLSAVEKAFGKDSGPVINEGFFKTASYLLNMTGPSGKSFNYSDAGQGGGLQPAMFWLANRMNDPSLLWSEKYHLLNKALPDDRLFPAIMIWGAGITMDMITPPARTVWAGGGKNPVALMRSSWTNPDALYAGLKGGSPAVNHGHMDVGSFIMEYGGERWAMDFGMQDYNSLETAGVNLWSMAQNSPRWQVYRYNNAVHNTLTVNGKLQDIDGYASITGFSESASMKCALTDITSLYKGLLKKSVRGIAIVNDSYFIVRDEVETNDEKATIRWNMLTSANVKLAGNNIAELTRNGKKVFVVVKSPASVTLVTGSTVPPQPYDAPNPGTALLQFDVEVPARSSAVLTILLLPEGATEESSVTGMDLSEWVSEKVVRQ